MLYVVQSKVTEMQKPNVNNEVDVEKMKIQAMKKLSNKGKM